MDQIIKNAVVVLLKRLQDQGNQSPELSMSIQMLEMDEVKYECETPTLYEVVLLPPTKPLDIYTKSCIVEILVKKCWYSIKEAYELVHREGGLIRSHVREKHAVEVVGDLRAAGARVEMRPEKSEFCTYEDSVVEDACEAPNESANVEMRCGARKYYAVKIESLVAYCDTTEIAKVLYDKTSMGFEGAKAFLRDGFKEFAEVYESRPAAKDLVSALEKVGAYAVAQEVDADGVPMETSETIQDIKYDIVLVEPVEERNVNKVLTVIRKELVTYKLLSAPTTLLYNLKYHSARVMAHMLANAGAKVKIAEKKSEAVPKTLPIAFKIVLEEAVTKENKKAVTKVLKELFKPVWSCYPTDWNKKGENLISFIPTVEQASEMGKLLQDAGAIVNVKEHGKE